MPAIDEEAFYLPVGDGERFCIRRGPTTGPRRGVVVHAPAFADEMNKSRRMTAWCARDLAAAGYEVVHPDLLGCGDSPGDFGDATWAAWLDDLARVVDWALARYDRPLWLWALRAGALLAAQALPKLPCEASLLLWQPVLSGRSYLTQFLRVAAIPSSGAGEGGGTRELLAALAAGRSVEVGGYRVAPEVASGLLAAEFAVPAGYAGRIVWIEVIGTGEAVPSPRAVACVEGLRGQGVDATLVAASGPTFWQTVEIEDCPAAVDATRAALASNHEPRLRRAPAVL